MIITINVESPKESLELTDDMLERNSDIYNAVFECISILVEQPELEWDMQIIGNVTDNIKSCLNEFGLTVRHPGIIMNEDGVEFYYDEL